MSAEANKAIARRYWDEVWSVGNMAMIDELFAPDTLYHSPGGTTSRGIEARKQNACRDPVVTLQ